jgi:O-antigen ligase
VVELGHRLGRLLGALFSFEALFALFLYSNNLKPFLPRLPFDETVAFMALSAPFAVRILWRHGLRREGLLVVVTGLLFFGWLALSMLWSPARTLAARAISFNLTFNLYCLIVGALVLTTERRRVWRFFGFLLGIGFVLSLNGLWIYLEHGTFRFYRPFQGTRAYLTWTYPVASASAFALVLALTSPFGSLRQLFGLASSLIFGAFLLVASARGPMLCFALSLLVPLLIVTPRVGYGSLHVPRLQIAAFFLIVLVGVYLVHLLSTGQMTATIQRFFDLLGYIRHGGAGVRFERLSYWSEALHYWSTSPLIGTGIGSFSSLYLDGREIPGTHPHNIVLEILSETGLIGLLLFLISIWAAVHKVRIARLREDPLHLAIWMLFLSLLLVRAMLSDDLAYQWELFLALGLVTLSPAETTSRHVPPEPVRGGHEVGSSRSLSVGFLGKSES